MPESLDSMTVYVLCHGASFAAMVETASHSAFRNTPRSANPYVAQSTIQAYSREDAFPKFNIYNLKVMVVKSGISFSKGARLPGSMLKNNVATFSRLSALNDFGGGNGCMCQGLYQTNQGDGCTTDEVLGAGQTAPVDG